MGTPRYGMDDDEGSFADAGPLGLHVQCWYHLYPAGSETPMEGRPATLSELTRLQISGRTVVDAQSKAYTRLSLLHLNGKREVITQTESGHGS